jgi:hypothetical protein
MLKTWSTKFVSHLLPTQSTKHRYDKDISPQCPYCHADNDSFLRLMQCPDPESHNWRTSLTLSLRTHFDKKETHPQLCSLFLDGIANALSDNINLDPDQYDPALNLRITQQNQLGWTSLFFGFISTHWSTCQDEYLSFICERSNSQNGQSWPYQQSNSYGMRAIPSGNPTINAFTVIIHKKPNASSNNNYQPKYAFYTIADRNACLTPPNYSIPNYQPSSETSPLSNSKIG